MLPASSYFPAFLGLDQAVDLDDAVLNIILYIPCCMQGSARAPIPGLPVGLSPGSSLSIHPEGLL